MVLTLEKNLSALTWVMIAGLAMLTTYPIYKIISQLTDWSTQGRIVAFIVFWLGAIAMTYYATLLILEGKENTTP